jgi:hypothetical protein
MDRSKPKNIKLAQAVYEFFTEKTKNSANFVQILDLAEIETGIIIKKFRLSNVITGEQVENTVLDFVDDLSDSADSNNFTVGLLKICHLQTDDFLLQLKYYISRRLFTLLKKNADENSKDYMRFNETVKYALKMLEKKQQIFFYSPDFYSANSDPEIPVLSLKSCCSNIIASLPFRRIYIEKSQKFKNLNLKTSLLQLLSRTPHNQYRLQRNSIVTLLFNLQYDSGKNRLIAVHENYDYKASQMDSGHQAMSYEADEIADELFFRIRSQFDANEIDSLLMLIFAWLVSVYPEYFHENELLPRHRDLIMSKKGLIDKLHKFLNEIRLNNLSVPVMGRTSVFNRLKSLQSLFCNIFSGYSYKAMQFGLQKIVSLLYRHYRKLFKGEFT